MSSDISEAQDVNVVMGVFVQVTSELSNVLGKMLEGTDPVEDDHAMDTLAVNARRIAELAREIKIHRLTFKHVAIERPEPQPEWQRMIDNRRLIEGLRELRRIYNYDLMTAKCLAEAYMGRLYAWKPSSD